MNKTLAAGVVVVAVLALVVGLGSNIHNTTPTAQSLPNTVSADAQANQAVNAELDQMSNTQDASLENQVLTG